MRLITLGDSLSSGDHSWPNLLSQELNCNLVNFALPASQNLLQIQLMQDWLLYNDLSNDDIIIWQIGWSSHPVVYIGTEHWDKIERANRIVKNKMGISHYHFKNNIIDNKLRISLLPVSPILHKFTNRKRPNDDAEVLQSLLFMFNIIKKICPKILIIKGNDDFVKDIHWNNMTSFLERKNIAFLNESIYTWCIENGLSIGPDSHPTTESLRVYKDNVLIPKLRRVGWL
jgi:hypothetical protein